MQLVEELAQRDDVAHIYANPQVKLDTKSVDSLAIDSKLQPDVPAVSDEVEWNISKVRAPQVWNAGYTGQGVVIGGQDTGYDWDHPALINQYRGWTGISADHNYNWHDAIHSSIGIDCEPDSSEPCDDYGHGTHTMGTMVGDDGIGNQVGMAPGARWIGCRNMDKGVGSPASYTECYQWFIAPTDLSGLHPRPDLAPDVINNSWSCPETEGCTDPAVLQSVVENVRTAGIITVHSAGNNGSGCGTVNTPAAIYDASFSVGSTDSNDTISAFSSRGPVTVDSSNRPKPDISAPGEYIRSSQRYGGYTYMRGTSMAAPHVSGLVALMISADPTLAGDVDQIEFLITQNALPRTATVDCGGVPGTQIPNNTYGWGRIDALSTVAAIIPHQLTLEKEAHSEYYLPGHSIGFSIQITHSHPLTATNNLVITDVIPANTNFITATLPFTRSGDLIRWELDSLDQQAAFELYVKPPPTYSGTIVNQDYGILSDEVPFILGTPVTVTKAPYSHLLPFILYGLLP